MTKKCVECKVAAAVYWNYEFCYECAKELFREDEKVGGKCEGDKI